VFKISVGRLIFSSPKQLEYFKNIFLPKYIIYTFISGLISLGIFYVASRFVPLYLGLTPIIHPFIINHVLNGNFLGVLVGLTVVFFSGKRSTLISSLVVLLAYFLKNAKNKIRIVAITLAIIFPVIIGLNRIDLDKFTAYNKYKWTFEQIPLILENPESIDFLTGGRYAEIRSIAESMEYYDYAFGEGVGYTYELKSERYGTLERQTNAHFTPISIISKYGILFFAVLIWYIYYPLLRGGEYSNKRLRVFFAFLILALSIDYLFAYGIFTNRLMPFAIGFFHSKSTARV
jgi:hypothetical protein